VKVGIFSDLFYPYLAGGGENRYYHLAKHLVAGGDDVLVVTSKLLRSSTCETLLSGRLRIHRIGLLPHPTTRRSILSLPGYALCSVLHARLVEECDILDLNTYASAIAGKVASVLKKKPSIVTVHDLFAGQWSSEHNLIVSMLGNMSERLIASINSRGYFITVSESTKRKMIRELKVDPERIFVVPNGVDFERMRTLAKGVPKEFNRIVYLGRLIRYKKVDQVLQVVRKLRSLGLDVKADIIGDGPQRERLESLAQDIGVSEHVKFWGFLRPDDVARIMSSASVFVNPSLFEGFGMSVLEAMAFGTPVAAYDLEAYREYAKDGANCLLASPRDLDCFTNNVRNLIVSPAIARNMSRNGIETARRYDWSRIAEKVRAIYRKVIA
jgi:glycosyltransferase involved in cell wall biosynthesis